MVKMGLHPFTPLLLLHCGANKVATRRRGSALALGDLVEDRLPRLLLLVNEGGGLGG
jgi:hypothetical protein